MSRTRRALTPRRSADIRARLLAYYDASARALPWRRTLRDPYAIWVSEVMAQQTRVETVIPYFERWMRRFPDVAAVAAAPLDDVLKQWEGLGYYARARQLHAAAQVICERYAGELPSAYDALRALPGVGEYTAGAVASIAFRQVHAAVDGNVRRVLARLFDVAEPSAAWLRETAAALVPHDRPGDFNQAVMELGARICTPRAPRCATCPLRQLCRAYAAGTQLDRPRPRRTKAPPLFLMATAVIRAHGHVLLVRRPDRGLLAGMWGFPAQEVSDVDAAPAAALDLSRALLGHAPSTPPRPLCTVDHTFSHRRERYICYLIENDVEIRSSDNMTWVGADRTHITLPRGQQRIHSHAFAPPRPLRDSA